MIRSAIVTGASSGIGRAVAHTLHASGWGVTITGRRRSELDAAAAEMVTGAAAHVVTADMSDPAAPADVLNAHLNRFVGIDALVYCAGIYDTEPITDVTAESWDRTFAVAVRGAALMSSVVGQAMKSRKGGRIVLVSSVNALQSEVDTSAYSSAKAAVSALARSIAIDLAPYGITANSISPGWVYTPMTKDYLDQRSRAELLTVNPLGRAGTAEEIASVAEYLVAQAPAFLTGTDITVDGGQTAFAAVI